MLFEIALVQRLSLLLGHPTYALGVLLAGLIAATGAGSLLSERLPLASRRLALGLPLAAALMVLSAREVVEVVIAATITESLGIRALASLAVILPAGLLLGCMVPLGMRLWRRGPGDATPWYWGLNGVFGVLASTAAVAISIHAGTVWSFRAAALAYVCLALATGRVTPGREPPPRAGA
jgi:hypothetical protein